MKTEASDCWVVLGASSSVARAFARAAAQDGAAVVLAGRDMDDLERTAADLRLRSRLPVTVVPFDATQFDEHAAFAAHCREIGGGEGRRLNLFLAFGTMPTQEEIARDFNQGLRTIDANYTGAASVLSRFAPILTEQRGGHVVVLSSVAGDRGRPKNYVYGSAKGALNLFLQGFRAEMFKAGVAVTTVKAGFLDTAMTFGMPGLFLVAAPEACARACLQAARKAREVVYFPWFWRFIMLIIKSIPERMFKKLDI